MKVDHGLLGQRRTGSLGKTSLSAFWITIGLGGRATTTARELLTEADPSVVRLDAAAKAIRAKAIAERVRHLAGVARSIFEGIEKDPLRIDRVRRFLTYYLPRAAEMAEAYRALESSPGADTKRLNETGEIIDRLSAAFTEYARNLRDAELDKLDIELKLLKRSLDEDLGAPTVLDGAAQRRA